MQEKIIELETKFSFQEDLLQELNNEVIRQQRLIEDLALEVKNLKEQLADAIEKQAGAAQASEGQEIPPHY